MPKVWQVESEARRRRQEKDYSSSNHQTEELLAVAPGVGDERVLLLQKYLVGPFTSDIIRCRVGVPHRPSSSSSSTPLWVEGESGWWWWYGGRGGAWAARAARGAPPGEKNDPPILTLTNIIGEY